MQETILIKSEPYKFKKMTIFCSLIGILGITVVLIIRFLINFFDNWAYIYDFFGLHDKPIAQVLKVFFLNMGTTFAWAWRKMGPLSGMDVFVAFVVIIAPVVMSMAIYRLLQSFQLTVTDKRVYGKILGKSRVDLPLDSISAMEATPLKGISISTSSGKIRFLAIKNVDEIYKIVNELLMERQMAKNTMAEPSAPQNGATVQLQKYKELLDSGVITQEEFDAKKKQLLGL